MKIFDRGPAGSGPAEVGKNQETARTGGADGQRAASSRSGMAPDTVEISTAAGRVRQALETAAGQRAQRVEALRSDYLAGTYVADSAGTSRAMVTEALAGGAA